MSEKHTNIIKKDNKNTNDVNVLVDKKIELFKDIIQRTILRVQKNKTLDILGVSDINACIDKLNELFQYQPTKVAYRSFKYYDYENNFSNNRSCINYLSNLFSDKL